MLDALLFGRKHPLEFIFPQHDRQNCVDLRKIGFPHGPALKLGVFRQVGATAQRTCRFLSGRLLSLPLSLSLCHSKRYHGACRAAKENARHG